MYFPSKPLRLPPVFPLSNKQINRGNLLLNFTKLKLEIIEFLKVRFQSLDALEISQSGSLFLFMNEASKMFLKLSYLEKAIFLLNII